MDLRLRKVRPSGSDLGVARIIRPKDGGGVGDLVAELLLDLCAGQVTTGDGVFLKDSGDAGTGCNGPEEPEITRQGKHRRLHF